jgi:hypothetical protein
MSLDESVTYVCGPYPLAQAERTKSGFRHHPGLGLVGDDQMPLLRLLRGFRVA